MNWTCPLPLQDYPGIVIGHGGGGKLSAELVEHLFLPAFRNDALENLGDSSVLSVPAGRLAFSTDSFVVKPLFFPGGSIGDLAVNGTVGGYSPDAPLSKIADRVVLEITERASLSGVKNVASCVSRLKALGFEIAIDDLGAGYSGLTSVARLEPEFVKLDMELIRGIHKHEMKRKIVRSMVELCHDMGKLIIAEGVEVPEEQSVLVDLDCDLLQGFLLARPSRFPRLASV